MYRNVVLCDQDLEGLLTGLYYVYKIKAQGLCVKRYYQENLWDHKVYFPREHDVAMGMRHRIEKRFGSEVFEQLYWASLTEEPSIGAAFLDFFARAKAYQKAAFDASFLQEDLFELYQLYRRASREYHRMLGLVRFKDLGSGTFYSAIEPDNNILSPLSQHFLERLSDQKWILHDNRRHVAAFFNGTDLWEGPLENNGLSAFSDPFESYWKTYYDAIAIEARKNEKRRQGFMPKKYWGHLPEMILGGK